MRSQDRHRASQFVFFDNSRRILSPRGTILGARRTMSTPRALFSFLCPQSENSRRFPGEKLVPFGDIWVTFPMCFFSRFSMRSKTVVFPVWVPNHVPNESFSETFSWPFGVRLNMWESCSRVGSGKVQRVAGSPKSMIFPNCFMVAFQELSKTTFCEIWKISGAPLGVSLAPVLTIFSGCDSGCVRGIRGNPSQSE